MLLAGAAHVPGIFFGYDKSIKMITFNSIFPKPLSANEI